MVTKKKVIGKEIKQVVESAEPIREEYKGVFPTIIIKTYVKRDANYFSIKQKLRKYGFDLFKKLKPDKPKEEKPIEEIIKRKSLKYNFNLAWEKYCKWWDKVVNKK